MIHKWTLKVISIDYIILWPLQIILMGTLVAFIEDNLICFYFNVVKLVLFLLEFVDSCLSLAY